MCDDSGPDNYVPMYPDMEPFMLDGEFQNLPSYMEIGAVPIEELEQLADEWERWHPLRQKCAQELLDLIAEYDNE